ncbi:MAG: hypothetical protein JW891_17130 [Candidatus Lokiarchaeota archaeon]|nr:hypothetical protein [Candidatus Lokiarchaeota archaeon]
MYKNINKYDVTISSCESIKAKLKDLEHQFSKKQCFLGFDGYIDSLYSLVQSRESKSEWKKMDLMATFGQKVIDVAGSAASIERVLKRRIFGGFTPNTSSAISALGARITIVAALGYPDILEIFSPITQDNRINAFSIANPGETLGLEFNDGKVMITDFANIFSIDWNLVKNRIGVDQLLQYFQNADVLGFGHWSLTHGLSDIWRGCEKEIFPNINGKNKLFFADLSDIKKRSNTDIVDMVNILNKINDQVPVLLSLNDQEAVDLSKALGLKLDDVKSHLGSGYHDAGKNLCQLTNLSYIVVHSPRFATISTNNDEHFWVTEGFTSKPRFTTGAGDHFHSGVVMGLISGLEPAEAIVYGNALTAVFVRTGNSPSCADVSRFIGKYMEYIENDNPVF